MQADGKKIVDPNKQNSLSSRLRMELIRPLRVAIVSKGPDTELLVANPVELSGKGRPLVFYDITLALKMLDTCIFLVLTLPPPPLVSFMCSNCSMLFIIVVTCDRLKLDDTWLEIANGKYIESWWMKGRDCVLQGARLRKEYGECWWAGNETEDCGSMLWFLLDTPLPLCTVLLYLLVFRSNWEV